MLDLNTPCDALFNSLSKFAIPSCVVSALEDYTYTDPPLNPRISVASIGASISEGLGLGGSGSTQQAPGLLERNPACLRVLINSAVFLGGSLGQSWYGVLEVMQNAEYVTTSKGIGVGVSAGVSSPGSRVVSAVGSTQGRSSNVSVGAAASGGTGEGGGGEGRVNRPLLLMDLDPEYLYNAVQKLFESSKASKDGASHDFVGALCRLSGEMVNVGSTNADGVPSESMESLTLSPNSDTEMSHRRRFSGIHIPRTLRSGDFGISKLLTISQHPSPNIPLSSIAWDTTPFHLLSIIRNSSAPSAICIQAAMVLDEILIAVLKNLGTGSRMGRRKRSHK